MGETIKPCRTFKKGDKVPEWLYKPVGFEAEVVFGTNGEVYYSDTEGYKYEVYPEKELEPSESVIVCTSIKPRTGGGLLGAPTLLSTIPRRL